MSTTMPFVVGQWVRGRRFYGREAEIREILHGARNSLWLLGTRRIGKTSLLKQLELMAAESPELGYWPLFWDFQGAEDPEEFHLGFRDALLDAEEGLGRVGLSVARVDAGNVFQTLARLRRELSSKGLKLLLLCDEVEELIKLQRQEPPLLRRLRRELQSHAAIRSVLASTIRLWALSEAKEKTSPFLHGFTPPLYLQMLTDDEARALLRQTQLPRSSRPGIEDQTVEQIRARCGNHPYLLQLVGKRYLETQDVEAAIGAVAADRMVRHFFSVDFEMLAEEERRIVEELAQRPASNSDSLRERVSLDPSAVAGGLLRLEELGFVRRDDDRRLVLANELFRSWLRRGGCRSREHPTQTPIGAADRAAAVTDSLSRAETLAQVAPQELFELVYDELRGLAARYMYRERREHTLQPTALVHEAYLKLIDQTRVDWQGRTHFFAVGAQAMRRILIDHARRRGRAKRGGDRWRVTLVDVAAEGPPADLDSAQLMDLDRAIEELARVEERQARVVELRFFAGLNMAEVAEALGVSKRTAESDWAAAREWLKKALAG